MNSYNTYTYIIILVTNLCLFRSLIYGTELKLIADLYLLRTYTYDRLILIPIFHRTHTYSNSSYTVLNLYIYLDGGTYPHTDTSIYLILVQISRKSYRAYAIYRGTLRYYKAYTYTIGLILILQRLHLFGGTRRYYRDITELILIRKYL